MSHIISALVSAIAGWWLGRNYGKTPNLVYSYTPLSPFRVNPPSGESFNVYTYQLVIGNTGLETANHVIISHTQLPPNHLIYPNIKITIDGNDLCFDKLRRNEFVVVAYLHYDPTLTPDRVYPMGSIKCDEALAKYQPLQLMPVPPKWLKIINLILYIIGLILVIGTVLIGGIKLWGIVQKYLPKIV